MAADKKYAEGSYLVFQDEGPIARGRKTRKFSVLSRHSQSLLGYVKYYVPWRQYTLFPIAGTIFDKKCLREAADFCEKATTAQREARVVPDRSWTAKPGGGGGASGTPDAPPSL